VARPKFNPGMIGSGSIRRPVENRTMVMMSATSDRYRGGFIRKARESRPSMQLSSTVDVGTVDLEAQDTATEYTGRFNEPL
jgi:hypothetical protein